MIKIIIRKNSAYIITSTILVKGIFFFLMLCLIIELKLHKYYQLHIEKN